MTTKRRRDAVAEFPNTQERLPVPDPTSLTTMQLQREIHSVHELINEKVAALRDVLETKLNCTEEKIAAHAVAADRLRELVEIKVDALVLLRDEKFNAVQIQFTERDKRFDLRAADDKAALRAAIDTQRTATVKSDATFEKSIDEIRTLMKTISASHEKDVADLKSRVDRYEGKDLGSTRITGLLMGAIGLLVSMGTLIVLVTHH